MKRRLSVLLAAALMLSATVVVTSPASALSYSNNGNHYGYVNGNGKHIGGGVGGGKANNLERRGLR